MDETKWHRKISTFSHHLIKIRCLKHHLTHTCFFKVWNNWWSAIAELCFSRKPFTCAEILIWISLITFLLLLLWSKRFTDSSGMRTAWELHDGAGNPSADLYTSKLCNKVCFWVTSKTLVAFLCCSFWHISECRLAPVRLALMYLLINYQFTQISISANKWPAFICCISPAFYVFFTCRWGTWTSVIICYQPRILQSVHSPVYWRCLGLSCIYLTFKCLPASSLYFELPTATLCSKVTAKT